MPSPKPKKAAPRSRRNAAKPEPNGVAVAVSPAPTDAEIRIAAYFKWVAAGSPAGDDQAFWYQAERELRGNGHAMA